MVISSEIHRLAGADGLFLGFADFKGGQAIDGGDDAGFPATGHAFDDIIDFLRVTIALPGIHHAGVLAGFGNFKRIRAACQVEVDGGVFAEQRVGHVETLGHQPASLRHTRKVRRDSHIE